MTEILLASTPKDIAICFPLIQELRPKYSDKTAFVEQILRQNKQGYSLSYIKEGDEAAACVGFRVIETLTWGKILYIDDLVTREKSRKQGYGKILLNYAIEHGRQEKCSEVHLDSGHHRHDAHRLYLKEQFTLACHHFSRLL